MLEVAGGVFQTNDGWLYVISPDRSLMILITRQTPSPATSLVHSHWSRNVEARLSLVESNAAPALLCHKEPARRIQSPLLGALERKIPCSSLVLYGIRDRWLPCTERSYYGAGIRHKRAGASNSSEVFSTSRWTSLDRRCWGGGETLLLSEVCLEYLRLVAG